MAGRFAHGLDVEAGRNGNDLPRDQAGDAGDLDMHATAAGNEPTVKSAAECQNTTPSPWKRTRKRCQLIDSTCFGESGERKRKSNGMQDSRCDLASQQP